MLLLLVDVACVTCVAVSDVSLVADDNDASVVDVDVG